jgi:predicted anti-sigma-YlaC factor YlaD
MRARARRLYLRARDYGLRGLEVAHPGMSTALASNPRKAIAVCTKKDVPQLYWTAASWAAAIAQGKDQPTLIAEIPQMEALIDRAAALDPDWDNGSIHGLLISYEMARQGATGAPTARARAHFEKAVALAKGKQASPYVTFAESVCVETQDRVEFESLLQRALDVDPDAQRENRLVNLIMQRRARWLLSRADDLFLSTGIH